MSEPILFDTNILVYAHNLDSPYHLKAISLVRAAIEGVLRAVLAQQNLLEFYSIITDPKRVSKPLPSEEASGLVKDYLNSPFKIIFPDQETLNLTLSFDKGSKGGEIFDTFLVATMLSNNVKSIITVNTKDFKTFPDIKIFGLNEFEYAAG